MQESIIPAYFLMADNSHTIVNYIIARNICRL